MTFADTLRPPAPFDPSAPAYKDWLHLNTFDASSNTIGIFNVSLHGSPRDHRSRAVGTALLHSQPLGWAGNLEVRGLSEATIGPRFIGLSKMGFAVVPSPASVMTSVVAMDGLGSAKVVATAVSSPLYFDLPLPFGSGWISWNVIPLLRLEGTIDAHGTLRDLSHAYAYHDHNWGRWHWGDNIGWEWGCFMSSTGRASFVFARTTDRAHQHPGSPWLSMHTPESRRRISAHAISIEYETEDTRPARRFPGALAALHQERMEMALPSVVRIQGDDGLDHMEIAFRAHSSTQLITGDPIVPGYGFIHELPGEFEATGETRGQRFQHSGLGVFEYVC